MGEVSTIGLDLAKSLFSASDRCHAGGPDEAGKSGKGAGVFLPAATLFGWDRSMTVSASLGPRTSGAWTYGQTDTSELCEGLPQPQ